MFVESLRSFAKGILSSLWAARRRCEGDLSLGRGSRDGTRDVNTYGMRFFFRNDTCLRAKLGMELLRIDPTFPGFNINADSTDSTLVAII